MRSSGFAARKIEAEAEVEIESNSRFAGNALPQSASQILLLRSRSILRLWRGPFGLRGRRFNGQAKRLLYFRPNLAVLCRTTISKGLHTYGMFFIFLFTILINLSCRFITDSV